LELLNEEGPQYVAFLPIAYKPENASYLHLIERVQSLGFPVEVWTKSKFARVKGLPFNNVRTKARNTRLKLRGAQTESLEADSVQKKSVAQSKYLVEDIEQKIDEGTPILNYLQTMVVSDADPQVLKQKINLLMEKMKGDKVSLSRATPYQLYLFAKNRFGETLELEDKNFIQTSEVAAFAEDLFFVSQKVGQEVGFYYSEDRTILKNFSLSIPKGETIALVGQSGSGKTTIANLLARFYDVTEGQILIDGHNIKDLKLSDYRKLIGMVTQESVLFNDSVYNNILMGKPEATQEEVEAAAKIANAHQFIMGLAEGYQTNIGDDGNKLSGGQKQRISIARAVLKNPPIMILDEATSALDTESERFVQEALEKMMENRTSLVIAHRLSTIQKADWIVVMERGMILEQGTHKELIDKNGAYKKLVELQDFE